MSTQTTIPQAEPDAPKQPRSFGLVLRSDEGSTLRIQAVASRRDGSVQTFVVHQRPKGPDGKRFSQRGATATHASLEAARAAVERIAAEAVKKGWQRPQRRTGFTARPDAFDLAGLPAPPKAKKR